ncbi:carotenoid cleavage dioxygenase [Sinobacterium caligoides]|uniref:Carotenoid cleavage dioxygenase n=1 Tax=Sinobacterium caligoides TaxID=933926 RepID=A0A3N2DN56_9GAMM|nr:carotenoid oxygenase family protein [Sinobacterium caligoides]ROS01112.1 carotenoid cleavage dioxygenase [Sinobacterium caligoides]
MTITDKKKVQHSLKPSAHPYLNGAWTPNFTEYTATEMTVIGEIPHDIDGVYLRNTENPVHEAIGHYHPFDGDGMLHAMSFKDGKAEYRNRFIRTKGFNAEQEAGRALWTGIANDPTLSERPGWGAQGHVKDSSSTDVVVHAGKVLSTFWQCGEGYQLDPHTLAPLGTVGWAPAEGISAHPKVDERSGEMLFFNYSKQPPYQHYGVVDRNNQLVHYTPVPLPGPRLPHDMAFSENYSILVDLPLYWDPELLEQGRHHARYYADQPSRFGILPRYGTADDVQWFEASATYVLHWMNAYEEGDEIVLDGYFQDNPDPEPLPGLPKTVGKMMANLDIHSFQSKLHRWRFNLKTGEVQEQRLDERALEFGTFNQQYAGRKSRYLYSVWGEPNWFLFSGIVKHDLETGESFSLPFGEQRFGSEAPFAPRVNAKDEDDGYLVSFITDMKEDRSECVLIDAKDIEAGPVCRIILPHRICSGTHATWADGASLRKEKNS